MPDPTFAALSTALGRSYRLEREIGAGGMATVYLATDLKHERPVAVKVMRESGGATDADRFHQEIRVLARLRHPFILPLHDSGDADGALYFIMPYVDGESLRARLEREGALPVSAALEIARQVADALHAAHVEGIVHRDVKPENILLTTSGHALLADFGIARRTAVGAPAMTDAGLTLGTAAYMSPEQAMGDADVDARADLYALACVLFEMLAGRRPFSGSSGLAIVAQHISAAPPLLSLLRPDTPPAVVAAVARALSKAPADRHPDALAFAQALATTAGGSTPLAAGSDVAVPAVAGARLSVAVLPIAHIGGDAENLWFAEGLTEELTGALARLEGLRVVSRTSVFAIKDEALSLAEMGMRLGVEFVLEGSVRRSGSRMRLTVKLIRVSEDAPLWAETFDRTLEDIFAVQDEVTSRIVETITSALQLGRLRGQVRAAPTRNLEAYDLYLLGRHHWYQRSNEGMRRARELFLQAIAIDPGYAPAHSGFADATALLASWQYAAPEEMYPGAVAAARRALQLDPTLSEAHASIGFVQYAWEWDWTSAVRSLRQAIVLNPNNETAHRWISGFLAALGRRDDALPLAERARVLDPLSILPLMNIGIINWLNDRPEEAEASFRLVQAMQPGFIRGATFLAASLTTQSRFDEASALLEELHARAPGDMAVLWNLGVAYARMGRADDARRALSGTTQAFSGMYEAISHDVLGEEAAMFAALERGIQNRSDWMYSLPRQPFLSRWRADPRFLAIVARLHLPDPGTPIA